jgi:hypothetical protein
LKQKANWISFEWLGYQSGKKFFDKAAMLVPFRIEGIPHQFRSQFDLGATNTMVYGNNYQPYLERYGEILTLRDTSTSSLWLEGKKRPYFSNTRVYLDSYPVVVSRLAFLDDFGTKFTADSLATASIKKIGTVGADIFKGKVLVIDFPRRRMKILDSLADRDETRFDFVRARFEGGRIKIPFTIDGEEQWLMFDTGSSLFPVSTSPKYYNRFADKSIVDSIETSTWGRTYWVYGSPLRPEVKLGNTVLPKQYIYNFPDFTDFFEEEKMMGITGNAYFLNSTIAVDFKNGRFGVMNVTREK